MTRLAMTASPIRRAITLAAVLLCALCLTPPTLPGPTPPARALPQQAEQTDRSGPSEPAEPSDQPAGQQGGLSEFGSCLAGSGQGSVVILMDQSGSLRTTDPDRARVRAAQYLAERLASFSTTNGITLNVHVAGFAASYAGAGDWTALTPDTLETVKSRISAVGDDVQDYDTDYWNALEGARQDLVDHDASGCRAVAWLSDGEYDLDMRDSGAGQDIGTDKPYAPGVRLDSEDGVAQAEQAGTADICRPTGVADQLRSSGVTLLGLGLSDGGADFTFMRRIVGGGGTNAAANGVESCGDVSSPTGSFYPVSDIDSLLMAFDSISAAGTTVRSDSVSVCQGGACAEGESSFVVDGSLQDVHVLASSDVDGLEARLYPPGASDPIVMSQTTGPQTADGVSYEWLTGRTLQVDLAADSAPTWDGQWRLSFIDEQSRTEGEKVNVNLHLSSPLTLAWQDLATTELRQGETVDDVRLALLDHAGGRPVDTSRLTGALSATVTLTDSKGTSTTLFESDDVEDLNRPVNIPVGRDVALGEASVTTSVTVTTAPATGADGGRVDGTTLAPTQATTTVSINPPLDFPTLASPIDFGRLEEDTTAHAALAVTGPGCVWVPPDAVTLTGAPAQAGAITVVSDASSQDSCVSVPEGRTGPVGRLPRQRRGHGQRLGHGGPARRAGSRPGGRRAPSGGDAPAARRGDGVDRLRHRAGRGHRRPRRPAVLVHVPRRPHPSGHHRRGEHGRRRAGRRHERRHRRPLPGVDVGVRAQGRARGDGRPLRPAHAGGRVADPRALRRRRRAARALGLRRPRRPARGTRHRSRESEGQLDRYPRPARLPPPRHPRHGGPGDRRGRQGPARG